MRKKEIEKLMLPKAIKIEKGSKIIIVTEEKIKKRRVV